MKKTDEKDDSILQALIVENATKEALLQKEKDQVRLSVLTEELKLRWQQVMEWDNRTDRWMASYIIALVVGASWILNNKEVTGINDILSARNYDNSYFVLALATINAVYSLYISFMGYQIHQLRLYIYKEICMPLALIANLNIRHWEIWHRTEFQKKHKGKPEWRRVLYYPVITILPFSVSVFILGNYVYTVGSVLALSDPHNIFFYFVIVIQIISFILFDFSYRIY